MVFTEPLTWKCHVCGEERPDAKISVLTKPLIINGMACGEQNIRYCNDKAECIKRAKHKDFFGGEKTKKKSFFTLGHQGLVSWAICTNIPQEEAILYANELSPTGISSRWQLSEDKFPDGKDNPHDCPDEPGNKHYLLDC